MKRLLLFTLITAAVAYLAVCLLLVLLQRRLLYLPGNTPLAEQLAYAPKAGLAPWLDAAGNRIGWKREARGPGPAQRWLVLHGNAGVAVHRASWADALERVSPGVAVSVYVLEYPGYGRRPGAPTEASLTGAALAAFDHLPPGEQPTYLLGESLGCAVAAQVAEARAAQVGGLVLVAPFNRLADVAQHHYPWLPVRWLLRDRWRSDEALRNYPGPVAVLAAGRDQVVPARFAERLHARHPGRKWLHVIPDEDHNFFVFDQPWFREAVAFATARR
jgi:pimeloyl-ACP methyl ester carboxylesterase